MWKLTINLLICQQVPQKAFWLVRAKVAFSRCSIHARVWRSSFRLVCAFAELLALCEVERNGARDERCYFKRHDVGGKAL